LNHRRIGLLRRLSNRPSFRLSFGFAAVSAMPWQVMAPELIGRDDELEEISAFLDEPQAGLFLYAHFCAYRSASRR
jgi:hypothetical protein